MRSRWRGGSHFLCDLGQAAADGAIRIDGADLAAELRAGGPGLLFDQEYGLLALAPVYVLAATGYVADVARRRRCGDRRSRSRFIFGALLVTVGAFGIWWGGASAPARPIVVRTAALHAADRNGVSDGAGRLAARAPRSICCCGSASASRSRSPSAQDGLLINNARDGTSALLEFWSPRWELWTLAPTFIGQPWTIGWLRSAWWLAVAAAAMALRRVRASGPGWSAFVAAATLAVALIVIAITMPWLPVRTRRCRASISSARSRLAALDGFDARVRPAAMLYDPLRRGAAADVVPQLTLGVKAGQRTDRQPMRVIHNGRFSLAGGNVSH